MENSEFFSAIFFSRIYNFSRSRHNNHNKPHYKHNNNYYRRNYVWAVILLLLCPSKVLANTTVASPSSNAQGTVNTNNNGYQTIVIKQPIELITSKPQVTKVDLNK